MVVPLRISAGSKQITQLSMMKTYSYAIKNYCSLVTDHRPLNSILIDCLEKKNSPFILYLKSSKNKKIR